MPIFKSSWLIPSQKKLRIAFWHLNSNFQSLSRVLLKMSWIGKPILLELFSLDSYHVPISIFPNYITWALQMNEIRISTIFFTPKKIFGYIYDAPENLEVDLGLPFTPNYKGSLPNFHGVLWEILWLLS